MNLFSISQLAQYAGIKPHTIRIWEQRYNALQPERSEKNTRYYDGEQLRRLLNIVSLLETDHKVSELCTMPDELLASIILKRKENKVESTHEYSVSQLISAGMSYDEDRFDDIFEQALAENGMEATYKMIIYPLLVRVGVMWTANALPSVQEHFISNLLRQKILRSIDDLPSPGTDSPKWILFLPEDEFHEIGLLFAAYIIRKSGQKVIYLGSSVSSKALSSAITEIKPEYLLFFLVRYKLYDEINAYVSGLIEHFDGIRVFLAGNQKLLSHGSFGKNTQWLPDLNSLEAEIKKASIN